MTKYNVGDTILITVGEREFTTVIDKHGVQRFKTNSVINAYVEAASAEWDKWMVSDRSTPEPFGLNALAVEFARGKHSLDEMLTFYTSIGYSVGGFSDLSYFTHLDIRNPVWEKDHYKKLSGEALAEIMRLINKPYTSQGDESVRYFFDAVRDDKWKTDDKGNFVAKEDTIDRVLVAYFDLHDIEPWDISTEDSQSEEATAFIKHLS